MSDISAESSNKKKSLGRGLGSLLGPAAGRPDLNQATSQASSQTHSNSHQISKEPTKLTTPAPAPSVAPESRIWQVGIDKLRPSSFQPRSLFDKDKLSELAQSISSSGILQPIVARKLPNGSFEIIAGERRWRAAQQAGLHEVPVILKNFNDRETLEMALVENIQREDLNPIEEAEAYQKLAQEFHLTQQQVSEKVGKDRATVANAIRLLQLPVEVRDLLSQQSLSVGHAKVLLSLTNSQEQLKWAKKVRDESLTVRQLEKSVQALTKPATKAKTPLNSDMTQRLIAGLSEEMQKLLGTKVVIDYADKKGKISIHFYSDDELTQIIERMRDGCQKSSSSSQTK